MHLVCGIKFGNVLKQGEIDKTDVHRGSQIDVIGASGKAVERAAQITQGTLPPVAVVDDLHLKVQMCRLVDSDLHVKHKGLVVDRFAENDWICDLHIERFGIQMEQGADKPSEDLFVFLQNGAEHVVVSHGYISNTL